MAQQLFILYEFSCQLDANPTIGDVLKTIDDSLTSGGEQTWSVRKALRDGDVIDETGFTRRIKKGQDLTTVPLYSVLTDDEWRKLRKFNKDTITLGRIGGLAVNSSDLPYVIVPPSDFESGIGEFLQEISFKAGVVSDKSLLVVIGEDAK